MYMKLAPSLFHAREPATEKFRNFPIWPPAEQVVVLRIPPIDFRLRHRPAHRATPGADRNHRMAGARGDFFIPEFPDQTQLSRLPEPEIHLPPRRDFELQSLGAN